MNLRESIAFALRGVLMNKLRSALTMSGILIGVAAVIILLAAGTGASQSITSQVTALGANTVTITPKTTSSGRGGGGGFGGGGQGAGANRGPGGGPPGGPGAAAPTTAANPATTPVNTGTTATQPLLTMEDAEALVDPTQAPDVARVAPVVSVSAVTSTYRSVSHTIGSFTGSTPTYLTITNTTVQTGDNITETDYSQRRRIVVIGTTVAKDLAGGDGTSIVGQSISLNGVAFQVAGILKSKGGNGPQSQDNGVIAPLTAVQDTLSGYGSLSSISVQATSADTVTAAQNEVTAILASRHRVTPDNLDFEVNNSSSILETVSTITGIFTLLLGGVAGISLFVGGIGVMNIMLVTVTERTREIGIRKAIGAQRSDIVRQFLLESVILSLAGGTLGVIIGVLVGRSKIGTFQLVVAPYSIFLAFAVSVGIGLFFGWYPARRAASLRPIDALRYE